MRSTGRRLKKKQRKKELKKRNAGLRRRRGGSWNCSGWKNRLPKSCQEMPP
jgi:hypothetical protein